MIAVDNKALVREFIGQVWNAKHFDLIDEYLSPEFLPHGFPSNVPATREGFKLLAKTFHQTFPDLHFAIEDIIEEIFGEIEDEHDVMELVEKQISENEYIFSGRLEIDYLNDKYFLGIEENEEYDTLAGYILFHHRSLPGKSEVIEINKYQFNILKVSETKLEIVKLKLIE